MGSENPRRKGRRWAAVDDLDPELGTLIRLLRGLTSQADGGLRGLSARLKPEHLDGLTPPSYSTLSLRLRGENLLNDPKLIYAIIKVCAQPEQVESLETEAARLLEGARSRSAEQRHVQSAVVVEPSIENGELTAALKQTVELQRELAEAHRKVAELQHSLAWAHGLLAGSLANPQAADMLVQLPKMRERRLDADQLAANGDYSRHPEPEANPGLGHDRGPRETSLAVRSRAEELAIQLTGPQKGSNADVSDTSSVLADLRGLDPDGSRVAAALRQAIDTVLAGPSTGRYSWRQLTKAERLHLGTQAEISVSDALNLRQGPGEGYIVAGRNINFRFARDNTWLIPPGSVGELFLLVAANDDRSTWSAGVVRADRLFLSRGGNRDGKQALSAEGREAVQWLFRDAPLPENTLLHLPEQIVTSVLSHRSGQLRVDELFRAVQRQPISFNAIATVSMQRDFMKRVRQSRQTLSREGTVILGSYPLHRDLAKQLRLPTLAHRELMSARLARLAHHHGGAPTVELDGDLWTLATESDEITLAPHIPTQ
ncbi:NaeI family type II restriction endonuclease [Streptomyces sp. NPDC059849]|uniref:NaeI family type II restriction endonuclease n=1 Tax=Streptomyces sp. NPDC059849 TaxID=3346969 RepID=UPI003646AD34